MFYAFKPIVALAGSEWSFAQFRLPSDESSKAIVSKDYLHVVSKTGKYVRVRVAEEGGELKAGNVEFLIA